MLDRVGVRGGCDWCLARRRVLCLQRWEYGYELGGGRAGVACCMCIGDLRGDVRRVLLGLGISLSPLSLAGKGVVDNLLRGKCIFAGTLVLVCMGLLNRPPAGG